MGSFFGIAFVAFIWWLVIKGIPSAIKEYEDNKIKREEWKWEESARRAREISDKADAIKKRYPQGYMKYNDDYRRIFSKFADNSDIISNESTIAKMQERFDVEEKPGLIKAAEELRENYPLGYKYYVCGSLTTPVDVEYALKARDKAVMVKAKHKELTTPKPTLSFSPNKYHGISFSMTLKTTSEEKIVYKILRSKNPNKFNGYTRGEWRSFEKPDRFKGFALNKKETSELTLNHFVPEYELSYQLDRGHEEVIGIISFVERPDYSFVPDSTVSLCKCVIPFGSKYYEGYKNGKLVAYLSDMIVVKEMIDFIPETVKN